MATIAYLALVARAKPIVSLWFVLYIAYSLVARTKPVTGDIANYVQAMNTWPPPLLLYTLREPVVWLSSPILHKMIGNHVLTFFVVDLITAAIVLRSIHKIDARHHHMIWLAPTIMTSYVFLFGQQNIWRQHIAFVLLLWAVSAKSRRPFRPLLLLIMSVLSHNATLLLSGYWFDIHDKKDRRIGPMITAVGVVLLFFLAPYLGKSSAATAQDTRLLYVALFLFTIFLLLYANAGRLSFREVPCSPQLHSIRSRHSRIVLCVVRAYCHDVCRFHGSRPIHEPSGLTLVAADSYSSGLRSTGPTSVLLSERDRFFAQLDGRDVEGSCATKLSLRVVAEARMDVPLSTTDQVIR